MNDFAILAPVPLEHLESGRVIADETGFVAYGSRKLEFFLDIEERRDGNPVTVLIYASHDPSYDYAVSVPRVSWFGRYIGHEKARNGEHPLGMQHRPSTTARYPDDNSGHWRVFWHVERLSQLAPGNRFHISELQTIEGNWREDYPPRGPELVRWRASVEFPE